MVAKQPNGACQKPPDCHPGRRQHAKGLCKPCYHRELFARNPATRARQAKNARDHHVRNYPAVRARSIARKFGLSVEMWRRIYDEQDGKCAICEAVTTDRSLYTDHDHSSGVVRGLLCRRCNLGIGVFGDDMHLLMRAAEYISGWDLNHYARWQRRRGSARDEPASRRPMTPPRAEAA